MKRLFVFFAVIIYIGSCYAQMSDSLYLIKKINKKGNYYFIEVKRNDSLFLILSEKPKLEELNYISQNNLSKIKKGEYYNFIFTTQLKYNNKVTQTLLNRPINYLDIQYFTIGKRKFKYRKKYHYKIYSTLNLVGLFYVSITKEEMQRNLDREVFLK